MKKVFIFIALMILLSLNVSAGTEIPYNLFSGSITLNTSNAPVGAVLSATIGGTDAGSYTLDTAGWYAMAVTPPAGTADGATVTFSLAASGWTVDTCTSSTYNTGKEDGSVRWLDIACSGSLIITATGDSTAGGGGGGGAAGGETITVPKKITQASVINKILEWIKPSELGLDSLSPADVTVTELREVSESSSINVGDLGALLKGVTSANAKAALNELQALLDSKEGEKLQVNKVLKVYKVQSKINNEIVIRSLISVTVTADSDMTDISVIEVIPKGVAEHVTELIFLVEDPEVLQEDPVVQWLIPFMSKGLSKTFEYVVKKELIGFEGKTLTVGTSGVTGKVTDEGMKELPPAKPAYGYLLAFIIIVLGLLWYFSKKKR